MAGNNFHRTVGDLHIFAEEQKIINNLGDCLQLPRREYQLLHFLINNFNLVINKYALLELIWEMTGVTGSNTMEVHLCSLRRKIRRLSSRVDIQTVRGIGYRLFARS